MNSSFKNLRAALHRYETLATPLSRFVLDTEAIASVAVRIVAQRSGTRAAHAAADFLRALDAEMVLSLGLLADAADEAMAVVRAFDGSQVDPAQANKLVEEFLDRVVDLFVNEKVLHAEGHTRVALQWLSTPHVYLVDGTVRTIGGPLSTPRALVRNALSRMKAWVALCLVEHKKDGHAVHHFSLLVLVEPETN